MSKTKNKFYGTIIFFIFFIFSFSQVVFGQIESQGIVVSDERMFEMFYIESMERKMAIVAWTLLTVAIFSTIMLVLRRSIKKFTLNLGLFFIFFSISILISFLGIHNIGCNYCSSEQYKFQLITKVIYNQNLLKYADCNIDLMGCRPANKVIPIETCLLAVVFGGLVLKEKNEWRNKK